VGGEKIMFSYTVGRLRCHALLLAESDGSKIAIG
jgi:hypothetical protein